MNIGLDLRAQNAFYPIHEQCTDNHVVQVQVTALNREAARIRAHSEVHSAAK